MCTFHEVSVFHQRYELQHTHEDAYVTSDRSVNTGEVVGATYLSMYKLDLWKMDKQLP